MLSNAVTGLICNMGKFTSLGGGAPVCLHGKSNVVFMHVLLLHLIDCGSWKPELGMTSEWLTFPQVCFADSTTVEKANKSILMATNTA